MDNPEKIRTLQIKLSDIFHDYGMEIPISTWASEKDRWEELLVCVINQINPEPNIEEIRAVIDILGKINLTSAENLSNIKVESKEYNFIFFLFQRFNFTDEETNLALETIISLSKIVNKNFDGKIQRYMRIYFEIMRNEMCESFKDIGLSSKQIRYAVTHWLQNSTNAPLSLEHKAVETFYNENGTNENEFIKAADDLDINLAVIDDLLEKRETLKGMEFEFTSVEQKTNS